MVSVAKARRVSGTLLSSLSDDQVQEVITTLHLLAREQLWYNGSKEGMSSLESTAIDKS